MGIKRSFKARLLASAAGAAVLAACVYWAPALISDDMVSDDLETYLRENNMPPEYKNLVHVKQVRIYGRDNLLTIPHYAALCGGVRESGKDAVNAYTFCASVMIRRFRNPNPFDAFSTIDPREPEDREIYIRPPGYFEVNDYLRQATKINTLLYKADSDQRKLSQYLREFTLAHEIHHAGQSYYNSTLFIESDADLVAIKSVADLHKDEPEVISELKELVKTTRVINGVAGYLDHMSAMAIQRGETSFDHAKADENTTKEIILITRHLKKAFSKTMADIPTALERRYHVAKYLETRLGQDEIMGPSRLSLLQIFTRSVEYLNDHTKAPIITQPNKYMELRPAL